MTDLLEIQQEYARNRAEFRVDLSTIEDRIAQRKKQIERLEKRRAKLYEGRGGWVDNIIKPIAEKMVKSFPDRYYDILGPFGLNSNTSIHFYRKGVPDEDRLLEENCISITFTPLNLDGGKIGIRNYKIDTGHFAQGTIGEMNDMNHPVIPLDETTTIKDLIDYMMKANEPE